MTFADRTAVDTFATFAVKGTYVLRLTASDGVKTASDDVKVVVKLAVLNLNFVVAGTPKPGQAFTFNVDVWDANGKAVSGAKVALTLDTGDADTAANYSWILTTGADGRASVLVATTLSDILAWRIHAEATTSYGLGTRSMVIQ